MPYITRIEASMIDEGRPPQESGQLNYALTQVLCNYLNENGLRYVTINDCLGALEGAKLEFERRIVGPYEEEKLTLEGRRGRVDPYAFLGL